MAWSTGIDIGTSWVRGVVLKHTRQQLRLVRYAELPRDPSEELGHCLRRLRKLLRPRGPVRLSDSTANVLVRFLDHPSVPPQALVRGVRMDLIQHADQEGNLAADVAVLPLDGDVLRLMCALAQPMQVDGLVHSARRAGIAVGTLALASGVAADAWVALRSDEPEDASYCELVLDIGVESTRIALVRGRHLIGCRSVPLGGAKFTEELAQARGESLERAEERKVAGEASAPPERDDADLLFGENSEVMASETATSPEPSAESFEPDPEYPATDAPQQGSSVMAAIIDAPGILTQAIGNRELGPELRRIADNLYMQITSTMSWLRAQLKQPGLEPKRLVLCGGGGQLLGLPMYLQRRLRIPAVLAGMEHCRDLGQECPKNLSTWFAAIGAAIPASLQAAKFDLRSQDEQERDRKRRELIPLWAAAVILFFAGVLACLAWWRAEGRWRDTISAYQAHGKQHAQLAGQLERLRQDRDALTEDLRGIAGRIFAGRDLLDTIRLLKEKAPRELWITRMKTEGGYGNTAKDGDDTAIDRGSLLISGRVKPQSDGASVRVNLFEDWLQAIGSGTSAAIQDGAGGARLFASTKVLSINSKPLEANTASAQALRNAYGGGEFTFEVRLEYMPTQIAEVVRDPTESAVQP